MAEVAGFVSAVFGSAVSIITKLKDLGGISDSGIILYHSRHEIEYRISIKVGDDVKKGSGFRKKLSKVLTNKVVLKDISRISGFGFLTNENLETLGMITTSNNEATIDFPKIFKELNASMAVITIRKKIDKSQLDDLIAFKIAKVPIRTETHIESPVELILNHGELWYNRYSSFSVRNIRFELAMSIHKNLIFKAIPEDLKEKLIRADHETPENPKATSYLLAFERILLQAQDDEFIENLMSCVSTSSHSFRLVEVIPKMQGYKLSKSSMRTMIPGKLIFVFEAEIEDKEKAIHGVVRLNNDQYTQTISDLISKFRDEELKIGYKI